MRSKALTLLLLSFAFTAAIPGKAGEAPAAAEDPPCVVKIGDATLPCRMTRSQLMDAVILAKRKSSSTLTISQAVDAVGTSEMKLSPDGRHLASIAYDGFDHTLIMTDLDAGTAKTIITGRRVTEGNWRFNKEPQGVTWATNDVLAVDYGIEAESIDLEGKKLADLGDRVIRKAQLDNADSADILVFTDADDGDVALINAKTGKKTKYRLPAFSGKPIHWAFDNQGVLRAITLANSAFWRESTSISNWYRAGAEQDWVKLAEFKVTDDYWTPLFVPDQPDSLIVSSSQGRDTRAVFQYDTQKRELGKMLAGHPDQDILDIEGVNLDTFKRVVTSGMLPEQHWFEPAWAKIQASMDATLPGRVNILSGDIKKRILIFSYSDKDPGRWYVMNVAANSMFVAGEMRPTVDAKNMRPMEIMSYPAKDGLKIPAYLTKPAQSTQPMPTVVMIHGGPTVRDSWEWNPDTQLLAANGYVVFQPQFRGSSGFGRAFEDAGNRQWGLAMQDDVTAGVEYLIKQGIADPARICIYGASYGGYAALWGVAKTPDLYRCGISFAGVSDIGYMLHDSSDSNDSKAAREVMRFRIGDTEANQQQFDQVSPLKNADRIKAPLLIFHGTDDKRVPISHSKNMIMALQENHKVYEWHEVENEGHGFVYARDETFFYAEMLKFLHRYIGLKETDAKAEKEAGDTKDANAPTS